MHTHLQSRTTYLAPAHIFQRALWCPLKLTVVLSFICARLVAQEEPPHPQGLMARVPWTTSAVAGTPEPPAPFQAVPAFPELKFQQPVFVAEEPGSNRLVVAELSGKIYAFDPAAANNDSRQLFLDTKRELYSFSFHPDYEKNGQIFVFSPRDPKKSGEQQSRVSRFTAKLQDPRQCSLDSEEVIVEWLAGGHNGGEAIIGPDGYLYVSTGDSTSGSDPKATGQGVNDLLSVVMRLDVENPDPGRAYSIPKDNPFVDYEGARPEIWAFGFRNPWRMSFDRSGRLWVGDVGQALWEMIWIVQRGGNYGWSVQEGSAPFHPHKPVGPGPILPPVVEHHHVECRSITGGYVYEGSQFPELENVYVYGDYQYGKVWGVRHDGKRVTWQQTLADTPLQIASFGTRRNGDILLIDYTTGELFKLERTPPQTANQVFPRKLSETGLFASTPQQIPAAGVLEYSVNAPQWTDGATKRRFIGIPNDGKISFVERSGNASTWGFVDGSVLVETISLPMVTGQPNSTRHIESRLLVKQQNHWLGYSYLWNDEQTDAELVEANGQNLTLNIKDPHALGGQRQQTWRVPSRNECMVCHSRAAGFVLGINTPQMNRTHTYENGSDNQLHTFNHISLFTGPLNKLPTQYDALPNPYDSTADINQRARAYLHVHCSVCHVADGGGNAKIELAYYQNLTQTQLLTSPMHGNFGLANAQIVAAGDPYASVLYYRLSKLGRGRMPHLGGQVTDQQALNLIHDWIKQVPPPDKETKKAPDTSQQEEQAAMALRTILAMPESERDQAIDQQLASSRTAFQLARAVGTDAVASPQRRHLIRRAARHPDPTIRDLFERFLPENERTKRLGDAIVPAEILSLEGNADRGRTFFFAATAAQCLNCHKVQGKGGDLGPDLSQVGKKYKPAELLESLLKPSLKIDPKFATYQVITIDGKVFSGLLLNKEDDPVTLRVLQQGKPTTIQIAKDDIDQLSMQRKSLMPDRMLRDLTAQQAADLVAFLSSLR